jgi:hypothetical protein
MNDRQFVSWGLEDLAERQSTGIKKVNNRGWEFLEDQERAIAPYFTNEILQRISQKKACNILVVGEAGIWKSYCAAQIARNVYPRMIVDEIVYRYSQYYDVLMDKRFKIGSPIMFDEPQDALDHRDWYKEAQQALVKTVTSQRFMLKPLIIPIINPSLIDKTIRDYLVQFQVECNDRGKARVFRLSPSLKEDKTYYNHMCNLEYGLMDNDLCNKDSCLDCRKLDTCSIFRAQYERKKRDAQYEKYEQSKQDALLKESRGLTLDQIIEKVYPLKEYYTDPEGNIDVKKLRLILREPPHNIIIGHNKAYDIKTLLEYRYRAEFKGNT